MSKNWKICINNGKFSLVHVYQDADCIYKKFTWQYWSLFPYSYCYSFFYITNKVTHWLLICASCLISTEVQGLSLPNIIIWWHSDTLADYSLHAHIVHGYFYATMAELKSCSGDCMACNMFIICPLIRRNLLTSGLFINCLRPQMRRGIRFKISKKRTHYKKRLFP